MSTVVEDNVNEDIDTFVTSHRGTEAPLHEGVQVVIVFTQENAMLLSGRSQKSTTGPPPGPTPAQRQRMRALNIDRFSRVFFPFLFAVLNATYWCMFAKYI